jgi:hypothetical protein
MVEIKIKIEGLDQLTEAMALLGSALAYRGGLVNTAEAAVELMEEVKSKVRKEDTVEVAKETATKIDVTPEAPEVPEITIEQIREVFVAKNTIKGNAPKLKAILTEFGARKVTDLQEKDFPAVLKALGEI